LGYADSFFLFVAFLIVWAVLDIVNVCMHRIFSYVGCRAERVVVVVVATAAAGRGAWIIFGIWDCDAMRWGLDLGA
jgi:hypothetical protein